MKDLIAEVLELEWKMNCAIENSAASEEDRLLFSSMRKAQFDAWSEELVASYLEDLRAADSEGRNLQYEKFTRMLKNIAPGEYSQAAAALPEVDADMQALAADTWAILKKLTQEFIDRYPVIGLSGRPLNAADETEIPSVETYQVSEMLTYSQKTLRLFHDYVEQGAAAGRSIVLDVQKNTVLAMGFPSLDEAEKQIAFEALSRLGVSGCSSCGMPLE